MIQWTQRFEIYGQNYILRLKTQWKKAMKIKTNLMRFRIEMSFSLRHIYINKKWEQFIIDYISTTRYIVYDYY
jgi:hypothetical protein